MKKIIIFIAAIAFGVTVSAQHKGDFSVGGALGVSGGSFKTTVKYIGKSTSESTPSTVDFILNPYFNYFVIDNLELNAGLGYSMQREFYDKDEDTGKNYYTFTHTALFQIGAHYFVPLVGGILYYTPGINFGFGGGSFVSPFDDDNIANTMKIPFAFGCIQNYEPLPDKKIHVSSEVKKICSAIPEHTTPETVQDYIRSILFYWQKERVSQFQLTTDLRYFFSTVIHEYSEENIIYPDAAEIVSSCHVYDELERSLQYEMGLIYGPDSYDLPDSQQSLAKQVKNWLDMNFTTPITFKIFQDIFGHSEKYISALFKAEFGISPSKYIGELRLDMAKKLMQTNPDILLKDVAEMVGYTDAFYFSRVFKSHEGISPSQYAKLVKEKNF